MMRIEVPQLPPAATSPNWRGHWVGKYKASAVYHDAVFYCCVDARNGAYREGALVPFTRARLDLTFVFSEYRRRDRDNLLSRFKPGLDGLVHSGLILDDDAEHLEIGEIKIEVTPWRAPLTILEIEPLEVEECRE